MSRRDRSALEGEAEAGQLLDVEPALDRRLDVELLGNVGLLADQLARAAGEILPGGLERLPDVDRAPALRRLVRQPELQPQALDLLELVDRFVDEVAAQLLDRHLRVGEVPEDEADDHSSWSGRSAGSRRVHRAREAVPSALPLSLTWLRGRRRSA